MFEMFKKDYDLKKSTDSVKVAREIKKHLEALDFNFQMFAFGSFTEIEPKEGSPWDISHGKGKEIQKIGYSYVYVDYEDNQHKLKIEDSKYSPGQIDFYIYDN